MLYKRCLHKGRERDRCADPWYASHQEGALRARVALSKWTGREIKTKTQALIAYDELKASIRSGTYTARGLGAVAAKPVTPPTTFRLLAAEYATQYVQARDLKTADDHQYRVKVLLSAFGDEPLTAITDARIEQFHNTLRAKRRAEDRSTAYVNRPMALLRGMLSWAVKQGYLTARPEFELDKEDYSRWRRVDPVEEGLLLQAADPLTRALLIIALDTGMRRGEMLKLKVGDVDLERSIVRLRGVTTKDAETRDLPIATNRLRTVFEWLRKSVRGEARPVTAPLIVDPHDRAITSFRKRWVNCQLRAYRMEPQYLGHGGSLSEVCRAEVQRIDLHWHDLRHEFACRLDDRGVSLGVIQRLLGHANIATTERYLRRGVKELAAAAVKLDEGLIPADLPAKCLKVSQSVDPVDPTHPVADPLSIAVTIG